MLKVVMLKHNPVYFENKIIWICELYVLSYIGGERFLLCFTSQKKSISFLCAEVLETGWFLPVFALNQHQIIT